MSLTGYMPRSLTQYNRFSCGADACCCCGECPPEDADVAAGVAVLLISSELEEILDLSHRIVVMHSGRIVGEMNRAAVDIEQLGLLMGGAAT